MTPEHLSPAQRDMYEKAKAALEPDPDAGAENALILLWQFQDVANPAAVIDLLTQLGEARAAFQSAWQTYQREAKEMGRRPRITMEMAQLIPSPIPPETGGVP